MARSLWNGTIVFAQVAVPVAVHSAVSDTSIRFREVHLRDGGKVEHRRFCSEEEREVPYDEVVKGYEVRSGEWVELGRDEVKAAAGARTKLVELEHFVCAEEIDPVLLDRTYWLGAREGGEDGYRLLHDALRKAGRAGIGRWVFHDRERLVALRPVGGLLALTVLRFADALVDPESVDLPELSRRPTKKEVDMAGRLIEGLAADWDPGAYADEHREQVLALVHAKAAGEELPRGEEPEVEEPDDLVAALEASLAAVKG
jgi:DNA end-binding protein Ku